MDRSYGNVFHPNTSAMSSMSPMSPDTPRSAGNGQYKTNVNRQKTKKWVEAKVQSYDGDDWGNEYDEGEEEPLPPPPMRPMGPRSPASPPLATGQQFPPRSRPFQTPVSPAPSPGLRSSSGAPPLHIQTQQLAFPRPGHFETDSPMGSRPSSLGSHAPGEHLMSPQSTNIPTGAPSGTQGYPQGTVSPTPQGQRRMSPAPQTAGPSPARFPPRKSSMSQQDSPEFVDSVRQQAAGSRPDSGHKPWVEARPASPGSAKSPGTPSKQLPFIRPADIYKRMEEQQERERRSAESSRLSTDNIVGNGRIDSPSGTQPDPAGPGRQMSPSPGEVAGSPRAMRPSLAPVTERKSEYGIEGLIASYGTPEPEDFPPVPTEGREPMAPEGTHSEVPLQAVASSETKESQPEKDLRRFSTSPKLPDLARMSTFGLDLFSGSSSFLSDAPDLPAVPDSAKFAAPVDRASDTGGLQSLVEESEDPAVTAGPVNLSITESGLGVVGPTVTNPDHQSNPPSSNPPNPTDEQLPAPTMAEGLSATDAAASHEATAGMVEPIGETTQARTTADVAWEKRASIGDENAPRHPSPSGGASVSDDQNSDRCGAAVVAAQPDDPTVAEAVKSAEDSASMDQLPDIASGAASDVKPSDEMRSVSMRPASPNPLPPLQTASPLSPTAKPDTSLVSSMTGHELSQQPPTQDSPGTEPSNLTPATAHSEITPTAPLNPQRASMALMDMAPPSLERFNTRSTTTTISPVKESDKLREEIIRSLSPVRPGSAVGDLTAGETSGAEGANAVRESSYLPDLYDDYWASSDDKPENDVPDVPAIAEKEGPAPSQAAESSIPSGNEPSIHTAGPSSGVAGADGSAAASPVVPLPNPGTEDSRRRFSWEAEPERKNAVSELAEEPKSLSAQVVQAGTSPSAQTSPVSGQSSPAVSQGRENTGTGTEPDVSSLNVKPNPASISHQVSKASTLQPHADPTQPLQPPSPVSVVSDRNGALGNDSRRLSLAEAKALGEVSGSPIFPAPALEQHPAVAHSPIPSPDVATHAAASRKEPINIVSFRQIVGMQTPAERIKLFDETREQFAGTDQGLHNWITVLRTQHPEYANATSRFNDPMGPVANSGVVDAAQPGSPQAPQHQQPYYQQYLSASSSNLVGGQGARPMSNLPAPPHQYGSSGFGHSGNQVGQKSKVLLMAAGKAGKGLLSKGKSKLRGSGEKVFF